MNDAFRKLFKEAYGYEPSPIGEPEAEKLFKLAIEECTMAVMATSDGVRLDDWDCGYEAGVGAAIDSMRELLR